MSGSAIPPDRHRSSRIGARAGFALAALIAVAAAPAYAQRPGQGEDESAALIDEGRAALKRNKLADAAKALDQAIALNPRRVDAYVLRAAVHAARKEYRQGIELMRRAQTLAPTDEEVLSALGAQLVLSGDVAAGVPLLLQVIGKNAERYDAQLLLGHHFHATSQWTDAITAYESYFQHRPDALAKEDPRYRVDLADSYLRSRQPARALVLFRQAYEERKREDLRAKLGIAWSTAAIDCRKARPLLRDLDPIADTHPEVWLVDGQCALALGDIAGALALGRRYLDKSPHSTAAGHALVGEAQAARGNLGEARKELETARTLEPARRRWTVRLAVVLRRAGDPTAALQVLEQLGPPDRPASDRDWWLEVGESLLAKGDADGVLTRIMPIVAELPGDAAIRTLVGAAQLAVGQAELAIKTLGEADTIAKTERTRRLLVEALSTVGSARLSANDAAAAEPLLARAQEIVGDSPVTGLAGKSLAMIGRNLGIARLALDRPGDAIAPLGWAVKLDPTGITLMLAGRARALSKDLAGARPLYERALAVEKDQAVEVALDWAASELAGGEAAIAVTALERTAAAAKAGPLAQRHKAALAIARHAAGVAALRTGNGTRAVELLRASAAVDPALATKCHLALAAVVAGDSNAALVALKSITGQSCPFPPPADVQAAPILAAFTDGLTPRRAGKALERLTELAGRPSAGRSSGPAAVLLGTAMRVVALEAAREAYGKGQLAQARTYLTTARAANARAGTDEVAHNLAVLDLVEGRVAAAIPVFERLAVKLPEALVNLGVAFEKQGEPQKALDAWRRARKAGVRFAPLADWIESKERIHGGAP